MGSPDAQQKIRDLHAKYADICSRKAFHELDAVLSADAEVRLDLRGRSLSFSGPQELGDFIATSIAPFDFFQFVVKNAVIEIGETGSKASGRLWMSELRHVRDTNQWSTIFGVYHDKYRKTDGKWCITARQYHSLARINHGLDDCEIFDFPEGFQDVKGEDKSRS